MEFVALNELDDKRIKGIKPLIPPQILMEDIPLTLKAAQTIIQGRKAAENVIKGTDDRLLVVVGPCSIHDVKAAKEYGNVTPQCSCFGKKEKLTLMYLFFFFSQSLD